MFGGWIKYSSMKSAFASIVIAFQLSSGVLLANKIVLPALAHHAPSGWQYPDECCKDSNDCQMIHERNVSTDDVGYVVTLEPGEHRHAPGGGNFFILDQQVRVSGDSEYHVCIHEYENGPGVLCLYIPPQEVTALPVK